MCRQNFYLFPAATHLWHLRNSISFDCKYRTKVFLQVTCTFYCLSVHEQLPCLHMGKYAMATEQVLPFNILIPKIPKMNQP